MDETAASSILAIGATPCAEFGDAIDWLQMRQACVVDRAEEALALLNSAPLKPRWILLFAAHRGHFAPAMVSALHRAAPLARLVTIVGSWCEGEPRSGQPPTGVARVYWHQFLARAEGDYAGWSLPRTATPVDLFLQPRTLPKTLTTPAPTIAIVTYLREDYQSLADAVTAIGGRPTRQTENAAAVLWNGASLHEAATRDLQAIVSASAHSSVIALLDFPRAEERDLAAQLGTVAVVSKPFLLGDLRHALVLAGCRERALPSRVAG